MTPRPSLQDMVKAAMEGTASRADVTRESTRQLTSHRGESVKEASASVQPEHYSTEQLMKLASAVDYIASQVKSAEEGATVQPGEGPGALTVLEPKDGKPPLEAGQSGHAIAKDTPPKNPSTQADQSQVGNSNTGMQDNGEMMHGEQPVSPISNQSASIAPVHPIKEASGLYASNLERLNKLAGKKAPPPPPAKAAPKMPSRPMQKKAEDSLNPAHIEAGKEVPPDASASGKDVPPVPSDVKSQVNQMISSNDAAIDYTKGEAKSDPKKDVNQVLEQPALTTSGDSVLQQVFNHTGDAGVKISQSIAGDPVKVAAARALLSNLMSKVAEEKKQKGAGSTASGISASSLG